MAQSQVLKQQRKHERAVPKEWVSAFCQTSFIGIGRLMDLSKGGVSFQYVQRSATNLALLKRPLKLNLFETVTSQGVKGIEGNVVYDTEVPRQNDMLGDYRLRRCGIQFAKPNWHQSLQLNMFIRHFTVEQH